MQWLIWLPRRTGRNVQRVRWVSSLVLRPCTGMRVQWSRRCPRTGCCKRNSREHCVSQLRLLRDVFLLLLFLHHLESAVNTATLHLNETAMLVVERRRLVPSLTYRFVWRMVGPMLATRWAKTIKKNTNSTQNKSQTHRAKQLRHFWAQIVSWAPRHARKPFIVLALCVSMEVSLATCYRVYRNLSTPVCHHGVFCMILNVVCHNYCIKLDNIIPHLITTLQATTFGT